MPEPPSPSPMDISGCAPAELCEAFSDVLLDIKDVDADDYNNPMLCSEYVKEIYKYLRQLEVWFLYLYIMVAFCLKVVRASAKCLYATFCLGRLHLNHSTC